VCEKSLSPFDGISLDVEALAGTRLSLPIWLNGLIGGLSDSVVVCLEEMGFENGGGTRRE
jgi:hypothetical protein